MDSFAKEIKFFSMKASFLSEAKRSCMTKPSMKCVCVCVCVSVFVQVIPRGRYLFVHIFFSISFIKLIFSMYVALHLYGNMNSH